MKNASAIADPPDRLIDWVLPEPSGTVDLAKLFRPGPIAALFRADREMLEAAGGMPFPMQVMLSHEPFGLVDAIEGRLGKVTPTEFRSFFVSILGVFCNLASVELQAVETRSDFSFHSPDLYALRLETDGRIAASDLHLTEEQAAAWCLASPAFPSLVTDIDTIIKFRERGGPHILRDAMREQRLRLRSAIFAKLAIA